VIGPLQSVLNGGTAFEAITHSPAAVTFFVMSGVEHLYDVLISTHIAQDFDAYADPLISALMYRPHLLKGDLRTLANIPLTPTSRRSWTHFVCCTTHVVSDEGRGFSSDGVAEKFSDCSEYFEVTRKRKKKRNRAAAALKMSCKSSSQVDSHAPPHQPSSNNKRKGKREIRPGLNRRLRQELRASVGRTIAHKTRHGNSGEDSKLGRVAYIGDHAGRMAAQESSRRSGTGSCQNEEGQRQRSKDSGARRTAAAAAAATRGGVAGVGGVSGGWVGLTLSVRISASVV
jgi:hypothetical protein